MDCPARVSACPACVPAYPACVPCFYLTPSLTYFVPAAHLITPPSHLITPSQIRQLHEAGCQDAEILEKAMSSGSVLVGDVADEIGADLVLISSEAVHGKLVDANLLAEFVPCPVLLLP